MPWTSLKRMANDKQDLLAEVLERVVSAFNLSPDQKTEFYGKLEGAITASIICTLLDALSEDQQKALREKKFEVRDDLLNFLASSIPKERLSQIMANSIEDVIDKLLDAAIPS
jgi:hypothetical protein